MRYNFLSRPDIDVIDKAIELIATQQEKYSCWALEEAIRRKYPWHVQEGAFAQYREQYHELICGSHWPSWWNDFRWFTEERIAALTKFKQACIEAGKKEAENA